MTNRENAKRSKASGAATVDIDKAARHDRSGEAGDQWVSPMRAGTPARELMSMCQAVLEVVVWILAAIGAEAVISGVILAVQKRRARRAEDLFG